MKPLTKCIAGLLVLTIFGLYSPSVSLCAGSEPGANTPQKKITLHKPRIKSEPAQAIPLVNKAADEKKQPNWLLIGLGGALVVGLAAVIGGLGGGGGDGGSKGSGKGDITIEW